MRAAKVAKRKALQMLPRVINDQMAPKKWFNMTEERRTAMVQNLLATLIKEECLKTTASKAKFVKFYADRVRI